MWMRLHVCRFWCYSETKFYRKFHDPLAFTNFLLPFFQCSLSLKNRRCFVDVSIVTKLSNSAFLLVLVLYSVFCCKEKFPWYSADYNYLCENGQMFIDCWLGLCWFSKLVFAFLILLRILLKYSFNCLLVLFLHHI